MRIISQIKSDQDIIFDHKYKRVKQDFGVLTFSKLEQTILSVQNRHGPQGPILDFKILPENSGNFQNETMLNNVLVFNPLFCDNYPHILTDALPEIVSAQTDDQYDIILIPSSSLLIEVLDAINLDLSKVRLIDGEFYFKARTINIQNISSYPNIEISKVRNLKETIDKNLPTNDNSCANLIYYSRSNNETRNGRMISSGNEIKIINLLKEYATNFNLNFCIFNGQIDGQRMSTKEQIKLFRSAQMVVGPHGGGLANIIWTDPKNECKICEFTSGTEKTIQSSSRFGRNCNFSYSCLPDEIFEYSVIPFTSNSTDDIVEIDIDNLIKFLYGSIEYEL